MSNGRPIDPGPIDGLALIETAEKIADAMAGTIEEGSDGLTFSPADVHAVRVTAAAARRCRDVVGQVHKSDEQIDEQLARLETAAVTTYHAYTIADRQPYQFAKDVAIKTRRAALDVENAAHKIRTQLLTRNPDERKPKQ